MQQILHVTLRCAGHSREREVDVDEVLRQARQRAEVRQLLARPRAEHRFDHVEEQAGAEPGKADIRIDGNRIAEIAKAPKGAKAMPPDSPLNPGDVPAELVVIKAPAEVQRMFDLAGLDDKGVALSGEPHLGELASSIEHQLDLLLRQSCRVDFGPRRIEDVAVPGRIAQLLPQHVCDVRRDGIEDAQQQREHEPGEAGDRIGSAFQLLAAASAEIERTGRGEVFIHLRPERDVEAEQEPQRRRLRGR